MINSPTNQPGTADASQPQLVFQITLNSCNTWALFGHCCPWQSCTDPCDKFLVSAYLLGQWKKVLPSEAVLFCFVCFFRRFHTGTCVSLHAAFQCERHICATAASARVTTTTTPLFFHTAATESNFENSFQEQTKKLCWNVLVPFFQISSNTRGFTAKLPLQNSYLSEIRFILVSEKALATKQSSKPFSSLILVILTFTRCPFGQSFDKPAAQAQDFHFPVFLSEVSFLMRTKWLFTPEQTHEFNQRRTKVTLPHFLYEYFEWKSVCRATN